jgi:hypothetical protein
MGWKQCTTALPDDLAIQDSFEALFFALGAPLGMALFSRTTDDFKNEIFLLTPDAAKHSGALPGEWADAGDPSEHGWSLLVGGDDPLKRFGLQTPDDRKRNQR